MRTEQHKAAEAKAVGDGGEHRHKQKMRKAGGQEDVAGADRGPRIGEVRRHDAISVTTSGHTAMCDVRPSPVSNMPDQPACCGGD